jgi:dextranase
VVHIIANLDGREMTDFTGKTRSIDGLRAFYRTGEVIWIDSVPVGTSHVVARSAVGSVVKGEMSGEGCRLVLGEGTFSIEASNDRAELLAEEFTTVGAHQGVRPVHGFATSFGDDDVASVVEWNRALRSTVVQIYDWMASYTEPLGPETGWLDPSHRPVSFAALRTLSSGLQANGAVAHAYAPIYAVGNEFAAIHPEMLMYQADGSVIRFLDQIVLANPGNDAWQRHFVESYGAAMDAIGFDGLHIDTYGYPRLAFDVEGNRLDVRAGYESFLSALRTARPSALISFNQVDGVPSAANLPNGPRFRYCEVWPPNDSWRHFEGLLDRSSGRAGVVGPIGERDTLIRGSIACYPPVWGTDPFANNDDPAKRADSLRTALLTEAVVTSIGASALMFGDLTAVLCDPYYPKHARLSPEEALRVLAWRRFSLRCRDLFFDGEDTSWYEIGDENGSVSVGAEAPVKPEPVGGCVFARVALSNDVISVSVVDLTGSNDALWSEPTRRGRIDSAVVDVLVDDRDRWQIDAAILGANGDRFTELGSHDVAHRQGRALRVQLPLVDGWSVLRISRRSRS